MNPEKPGSRPPSAAAPCSLFVPGRSGGDQSVVSLAASSLPRGLHLRLYSLHPPLSSSTASIRNRRRQATEQNYICSAPSFGRTASNWARWIAKSTRRLFIAKPMPDLQVPGASAPQPLELRVIA